MLGAAASVLGAQAQGRLAAGTHTIDVTVAGTKRSYIVHLPRQVSAGTPLPLMLAFHGGGGEAAGFAAYAGLDRVADREGFVVVYPYGSGVLPRRLLTWNAGECCGYAMTRHIDDVGFAIAVIDDVARRTAIDSTRVYATGHSNGAMMAYRLAAERADRIAAIAPVAGAYDLASFKPSRPVAVLDIHSVDDPRALYDGGMGPPFPGTNVRSSHRPVAEGLDRWRTRNGCAATTRVAETKSGRSPAGAVQTATRLVWDGCDAAAPVEHWKLTGAGHGWPGNAGTALREELIGPATTVIDAAEEAWKFVSRVRR